jgi:hypothetical protein
MSFVLEKSTLITSVEKPKRPSDAEGARDLRLALVWIAALLVAGSAANLLAIYFGAGQ